MSQILALDGNAAVAEAMRQINPDVVAAYPITPQTSTVQTFSQFVADGLVDTEFVTVESEHSAMSACVGASAAGARVMTATSSAGLAFMWEILYVAASNRLPITMLTVNRALSAPINIHCDHSDTMGARDAGWIHLFGENPQEAYDNALQALRIAEHPDVLLPVMFMHDGFITSAGMERVEVLEDKQVRDFVGEYKPAYPLLDLDNPVTYGPLDFYDYYFEHKRQQVDAMDKVTKVILEVGEEFGRKFGRHYGLFETYKLEDAEAAVVVLSSTAGTARAAVDRLRAAGLKVGLLKPRVFRPFPAQELVEALSHVQAIGVMDRSIVFGGMQNAGPLYLELCAAMQVYGGSKRVPMTDYVFGLGGRDIVPGEIETVFRDLLQIKDTGKVTQLVTYLGVRE
ncbi:MAG: pyruvate ferredoxin oxidoreductase [Chloroflexi bacterium]|nr:pyruvate ferredoxin oxidoreductase [Chloroflexota bacterium]